MGIVVAIGVGVVGVFIEVELLLELLLLLVLFPGCVRISITFRFVFMRTCSPIWYTNGG